MELRKLKEFNEEHDFYEYVYSLVLLSDCFDAIEYFGVGGSIGRNEKSVFSQGLNDIDFVIVAQCKSVAEKRELEKQLCLLTDTKYTDILVLTQSEISTKANEQYIYDFVYGNKPIFETEEFTEFLSEVKNRNVYVNRRSILNLFMTRSYGFLINRDETIDCQYNRYQMKKVLLAYVDSVLILNNEYRMEKLETKLEKFNDLAGEKSQAISKLLYNYDTVPISDLRTEMISVYKEFASLIKSHLKLEALKLVLKTLCLPTKSRLGYTYKFIKLLYC